jgi:hypothetical protein
MKLALACHTKTHSSNKKTMSPCYFAAIPGLIAFENFCTKTVLRREDFCERYGCFSFQEGSDQRLLNSLHDLHCQRNWCCMYYSLLLVHASGKAPHFQFQLCSPSMFSSTHNTWSSHFAIKYDFWLLCWQQYYDFLLWHQAENIAFHKLEQLSSINNKQWRRRESREFSSIWLT